jgi:hypothetical protein
MHAVHRDDAIGMIERQEAADVAPNIAAAAPKRS